MDPSDILDQALALCELKQLSFGRVRRYLGTCRRLLSVCTSVADPVARRCNVVVCLLHTVMKLVKNFGSTPASSPCGGCIGVCKAFPPANRGSHGYVLRFRLEEEDEVEGEEEEEERERKWEGMVGNLKGGRKKKKKWRERGRGKEEEEEWRKRNGGRRRRRKREELYLELGRRKEALGRPWSRTRGRTDRMGGGSREKCRGSEMGVRLGEVMRGLSVWEG
ncbi:hypothetical protein M5K25_021252 [Dendrobium thyrsiflorum]|uniref:Uncharacterized protein n=1 Tax=Dendrobium thyrsiflorum TaxID=117978 RepID=A0ABD0UIY8_DENTH